VSSDDDTRGFNLKTKQKFQTTEMNLQVTERDKIISKHKNRLRKERIRAALLESSSLRIQEGSVTTQGKTLNDDRLPDSTSSSVQVNSQVDSKLKLSKNKLKKLKRLGDVNSVDHIQMIDSKVMLTQNKEKPVKSAKYSKTRPISQAVVRQKVEEIRHRVSMLGSKIAENEPEEEVVVTSEMSWADLADSESEIKYSDLMVKKLLETFKCASLVELAARHSGTVSKLSDEILIELTQGEVDIQVEDVAKDGVFYEGEGPSFEHQFAAIVELFSNGFYRNVDDEWLALPRSNRILIMPSQGVLDATPLEGKCTYLLPKLLSIHVGKNVNVRNLTQTNYLANSHRAIFSLTEGQVVLETMRKLGVMGGKALKAEEFVDSKTMSHVERPNEEWPSELKNMSKLLRLQNVSSGGKHFFSTSTSLRASFDACLCSLGSGLNEYDYASVSLNGFPAIGRGSMMVVEVASCTTPASACALVCEMAIRIVNSVATETDVISYPPTQFRGVVQASWALRVSGIHVSHVVIMGKTRYCVSFTFHDSSHLGLAVSNSRDVTLEHFVSSVVSDLSDINESIRSYITLTVNSRSKFEYKAKGGSDPEYVQLRIDRYLDNVTSSELAFQSVTDFSSLLDLDLVVSAKYGHYDKSNKRDFVTSFRAMKTPKHSNSRHQAFIAVVAERLVYLNIFRHRDLQSNDNTPTGAWRVAVSVSVILRERFGGNVQKTDEAYALWKKSATSKASWSGVKNVFRLSNEEKTMADDFELRSSSLVMDFVGSKTISRLETLMSEIEQKLTGDEKSPLNYVLTQQISEIAAFISCAKAIEYSERQKARAFELLERQNRFRTTRIVGGDSTSDNLNWRGVESRAEPVLDAVSQQIMEFDPRGYKSEWFGIRKRLVERKKDADWASDALVALITVGHLGKREISEIKSLDIIRSLKSIYVSNCQPEEMELFDKLLVSAKNSYGGTSQGKARRYRRYKKVKGVVHHSLGV
jgi:hypothetical protein